MKSNRRKHAKQAEPGEEKPIHRSTLKSSGHRPTKTSRKFSAQSLKISRFSRVNFLAFVLIFGAIGAFALYQSFAAGTTANLWIDTSGGSCTRQASPGAYNDAQACSSLDAANDACQSGDTVMIKGGNYGSQNLSGSNGRTSMCTIISAGGETALFACGSAAGGGRTLAVSGCIDILGTAKWITLDGDTNKGISTPTGNDGGTPFQGRFETERGCDHITFTRVDAGAVTSACTNMVVSKSDIGPTVQPWNSNIITDAQGAIWDGNTIHDSGIGTSDSNHMECLYMTAVDGVVIKNNTVGPCATIGIHAKENPDNKPGGYTNNTVENNIFLPGAQAPEWTNTVTTCSNFVFRYNIVSDGFADACSPETVTGNIFLFSVSGCGNWSYNVFKAGVTTCGTNVKTGTLAQLFTNYAGNDFHSPAGSPAIDAGNPANYTSTDKDGLARFSGAGPDAGPYEFGASGGGDITFPTVSITAPSNGATVSGSTTVSANASDNVGVVGVQFKVDGNIIGSEDTSAPYSISWNTSTFTNGSHSITAVARDAAGNITISSVISVTVTGGITPDTTPPTVSITAPSNGATVSGSATVSANASDNVGVVGVQFSVDGNIIGSEDTSSPYSITWDSTTVTNGSHSITATARDAANNSTVSTTVTATISNTVIPPSSSPLAQYSFNENSGSTAADSSGNNNTATLSSATWGTGKYSSGLVFNGSSGYASAPSSGTLNLGSTGTIEAWVKLSTLNQWHGIIAKGNANNDSIHNYSLEVDSSNEVSCVLGNGTSSVRAISAATLSAGTFYHLACSWNGTTLTTYINGVASGSVAQSITPMANASPLYLGQFGASSDFMNGTLDDVRMYNIALTPAQIATDSTTPVSGGSSSKLGDLNNDNSVNILDLSILLSHYGQSATASQGDLNTDSICNITDLSILLSKWGS